MSVFLTMMLVHGITMPDGISPGRAVLMFVEEMGGGDRRARRRIWAAVAAATPARPAVGLSGAGADGCPRHVRRSPDDWREWLSRDLCDGGDPCARQFKAHRALVYAAEAFAWLAQITLFLLLGLLVTPHRLVPIIAPILGITAVLLVVARPIAVFLCLLPFGYSARETAFASWVGLRGAVPIYLTLIPVLAGVRNGAALFRRCLWGCDRVSGSPGMDDLTGRTDPGLWKQ